MAGYGLALRSRLGPRSLNEEADYLRTACWITIAYLSGMRDVEVRELAPGCALTGTGEDGRPRYKLRGRVFKGRALTGGHAEWVVLEVVHRAVEVLRHLNDDPSHLFGFSKPWGYALMRSLPMRLNRFREHINQLFSTGDVPYIPNQKPIDGSPGEPWAFDTRQFRRTLAWHIAHQPFGVVAGARQYQHAKATMLEGYAGTSSSGFAAEVQAEESLARMDYLEDLYRDWNEGARASGGAAQRIEAEFVRVRNELGDVPGVVANPARLRTMLKHLTTTLHPGVLNDCFYNSATAACRTRAKDLGRPLPLLNMCLGCPNSRRSSVHLPRLTLARNQTVELTLHAAKTAPIPRLQQLALSNHIDQLDQLITEIEQEPTRP